jgi:hypothetical protein
MQGKEALRCGMKWCREGAVYACIGRHIVTTGDAQRELGAKGKLVKVWMPRAGKLQQKSQRWDHERQQHTAASPLLVAVKRRIGESAGGRLLAGELVAKIHVLRAAIGKQPPAQQRGASAWVAAD